MRTSNFPTEPELSLVIPFFNEEGNVRALFAELDPIVVDLPYGVEVIAVDDGSTDDTATHLAASARRYPNLKILTCAENKGQSAAFALGFRAARGRLVATLDGDLQIDPRDLPEMLNQLERDGVDLVYGWRKERCDPWSKRFSTRIANAVRNFILGESIHDTGCPLKVFRAEVLATLPYFEGMHRFYISLAHRQGWTSSEMIVRHRPRYGGLSKYGIRNRLFRSLRDCLAVRWMDARGWKGTLGTRLRPKSRPAAGPGEGGALIDEESAVRSRTSEVRN
ncbi:MAG: glycosyltransferase family 2 protein [Planctomycetota bacterium]